MSDTTTRSAFDDAFNTGEDAWNNSAFGTPKKSASTATLAGNASAVAGENPSSDGGSGTASQIAAAGGFFASVGKAVGAFKAAASNIAPRGSSVDGGQFQAAVAQAINAAPPPGPRSPWAMILAAVGVLVVALLILRK